MQVCTSGPSIWIPLQAALPKHACFMGDVGARHKAWDLEVGEERTAG